MEEFIELIENLNNSDITEKEYLEETDFLVNKIIDLALLLFIDNGGHVDYDNIIEVKKYGISIFPLEQDRFGWLIGGIQTKKGIISFG
jgi:hypothetical protein